MKRIFLGLMLLSTACSRGTEERPIGSSSQDVVDTILKRPAFGRLARARAPIADGARFAITTASIKASLPDVSTAPLRISSANAWIELTPQVDKSRPAERTGSTLLFRDAAESTDVVLAALDEGVEELRVLRAPSAATTLRWDVKAKDGFGVRVREGIAELVDDKGYVHLAAARPFAVDARGARRDLDFAFDGTTLSARLDASGLAYPIVVDPLWSTIAPFVVDRTNYAVTRLSTGKIVAGSGSASSGPPVMAAEVYDPATNTWASAGNMAFPRSGGLMAVLSSGKVFVGGGSMSNFEIYDPVAKTSVGKAPAPVTINTLAGAGTRVLVLNGGTATTYNSVTDAWEVPTNSPASRFTGWSLSSLADGRVVIIGGQIGPTSSTNVEIYRPTTNDFVPAAAMPFGTQFHTATVLSSGTQILIAGGTNQGVKSASVIGSAAIYDVTANTWTSVGGMIAARSGHVAALLPNNKVVVAGGGTTTTELFDPASNAFQIAATAPTTDPGPIGLPVSTGAVFFPSKLLFAPQKTGGACIIGYECLSGNCVDGTCCSSASCGTAGARCDTATKAGTCTKPNGITCGSGSECESGLCVDGVCCNALCSGQCQACNVAGKVGTCSPVYGAPKGTRSACPGTSSTDVCQRQICDGTDTGACHFAPPFTVVCGANTCTAGKETHVGTCNAGACSDVPRVCGVYNCDATTCRTSCTDSTQCVAGFYCDTTKSACVPMIGLGNKCSTTLPCNAGMFCTDGVCCGVTDCGAGKTCGAPGKEGTCVGKQGSSCTVDAECGSSACADGVCCDTACTGQCEACDVAASVGTCTPVTGKPHGARPACPADATNACANATCDGADRARCAAFPGNETECRAQDCKGGLLTTKALCDGKGNCPAKSTASCGGYRCDEAAKACKTTCASESDCSAGWSCVSGECKKNTSFCSADGLTLVETSGLEMPCKPYRCKDGKCQSSCATSDDCSAGTLCATDTKTCVEPTAPTVTADEGGGCSTGSRRTGGGLALVVVALAFLRRRRATLSR